MLPPVDVTDNTRESDRRQVSELRDRAIVDGLDGSFDRHVGQVDAGGEIALFDAVDDRAALEGEAAANGIDARVRRRQPRRDVELQRRRGRPTASAA